MKLKLNFNLLCLLGFFIWSSSSFGQTTEQSDSSSKHQVNIAFDLLGITALPAATIFIEDKNSNSRLLGKVQYIYNNKLAIDLAYGVDHKRFDVVRVNFTNYQMDAKYFQLVLNGVLSDNNSIRTFIGSGISIGNIKESGNIKIGDDFFDPYNETLSFNELFAGWLLSFKIENKFNSRLSLEGDLKVQSIYIINSPETQVIQSIPGGGKSWIDRTHNAFDINALISLKYRLF